MNIKLKLLLYASVFGNFSSALLGPIYALFVLGINGSIIIASISYAIYTFVFALLTTFMGRLEDSRFNKEKMVFLGYLILCISNLLFIFIQKATDLYLLQALMGIGVAIVTPAWEALYSLALDKGKESSEWGYWNASIGIAASVAALLGGFIVNYYGFKTLFVMMSIFHFISALISASLLKERR
ncbi:MAG: MFS transporter [Nanoarchaeota archaeon]